MRKLSTLITHYHDNRYRIERQYEKADSGCTPWKMVCAFSSIEDALHCFRTSFALQSTHSTKQLKIHIRIVDAVTGNVLPAEFLTAA